LEISIHNVREKSKKAFELLALVSILDNENIPGEILKIYFNNDIITLNDAIRLLLNYSLLYPKNDKDTESILYGVHELQQYVTQEILSDKEKKYYLENIIKAIYSLLPSSDDLLMPVLNNKPYILYNMEKIASYADSLGFINDELVTINIRRLTYFLGGNRDLEKAKDITKLIEKQISSYKQVSDFNLINYYILQSAFILWHDKHYTKSIKEIDKAYAILKNIPGLLEEKLAVYNILAQNYYLLGEISKAFEYSNLGKQIINNTNEFLGDQDAFYGARAMILLDMGQLEQAAEAANKCVAESEKFATSTSFLGLIPPKLIQMSVMLELGKYYEVYKNINDIYITIEKLLQNKPHYVKATALIILSRTALKIGEISLAENKIKECLSILTALNQNKSRDIAKAYKVYGDILAAQRKYKSAQINYPQSEKLFSEILKNHKIPDIADLYSKLVMNCIMLKDSSNAKKYFDLLKQEFSITNKFRVYQEVCVSLKINRWFVDIVGKFVKSFQ
jgi:tetratricopeptide (TPR) repeat protein